MNKNPDLIRIFERVTNAACARYLTASFMGNHDLEQLLDKHPYLTASMMIQGDVVFPKHQGAFKSPQGWHLAEVYIAKAILDARLHKEFYGTEQEDMMVKALVCYMAGVSNPMLEHDLKKRLILAKKGAIHDSPECSDLAEKITHRFIKSLWDDVDWLHRHTIDNHLDLLRKKRKRLFHPFLRQVKHQYDRLRLGIIGQNV